jgi:hypothetical protein
MSRDIEPHAIRAKVGTAPTELEAADQRARKKAAFAPRKHRLRGRDMAMREQQHRRTR